MEPRFKVGDRVRVIQRTEFEHRYRCRFVDDMAAMAGQIYTISSSRYRGVIEGILPDDGYVYILKEVPFTWASSMLEPAEETPSSSKEEPEFLDFTPKKKHYSLRFTV